MKTILYIALSLAVGALVVGALFASPLRASIVLAVGLVVLWFVRNNQTKYEL